MGIDIGRALREGASRTAAKNGLILAAAFAGIALLTTILLQSLYFPIIESLSSVIQNTSPQEIGISEAEYNEMTEAFGIITEELQANPFIYEIPVGVIAGGLLTLAIASEITSIIAVRVFSIDNNKTVSKDFITNNLLLVTLNGFIGKLLILLLVRIFAIFVIIPGVFLAIMFYFTRQEIALKNKNFIQAMADSWRIIKGNRVEVFLIGGLLFLTPQILIVALVSALLLLGPVGSIVAAMIGGGFSSLAAAVATRAYVQIEADAPDEPVESDPDDEPEDPYDAALGPDDLTR